MILKYLSILLVLHVLFQPSTCKCKKEQLSDYTQTEKTTATKQFAALNTTIVNCFGEHKLNATSTITTPETCPSLTKVFKCIYDAAKMNKAVLKELTADNRCDHVEKVTLIRLVYLQKYPNEALEDCNVDSETIVPAMDKPSAGTRNHGAGVVGAILMAAAVVIVI